MARREPCVQSIKRKKKSHSGENISQNQIFETVERERERDREREEGTRFPSAIYRVSSVRSRRDQS